MQGGCWPLRTRHGRLSHQPATSSSRETRRRRSHLQPSHSNAVEIAFGMPMGPRLGNKGPTTCLVSGRGQDGTFEKRAVEPPASSGGRPANLLRCSPLMQPAGWLAGWLPAFCPCLFFVFFLLLGAPPNRAHRDVRIATAAKMPCAALSK